MSVSEPGKIITPWAESGLKNTIPPAANPATGRAGFDQGFSAINMTAKEAGGIPPFGQDFNGIFYEVTNILRYMQAGGQPTFDASLATAIGGYPKGAMVLGSDGVTLWQSRVDSNFTNPNTDSSGWGAFDIDLKAHLADPSGSSIVGFVQQGAGAVLRTSEAKLRELVSVKDYGAKGDGITDDISAIETACAAIQALFAADGIRRTLWFPSGTYRTSRTIFVHNNMAIEFATRSVLQNITGTKNFASVELQGGAKSSIFSVIDGYECGIRVVGNTHDVHFQTISNCTDGLVIRADNDNAVKSSLDNVVRGVQIGRCTNGIVFEQNGNWLIQQGNEVRVNFVSETKDTLVFRNFGGFVHTQNSNWDSNFVELMASDPTVSMTDSSMVRNLTSFGVPNLTYSIKSWCGGWTPDAGNMCLIRGSFSTCTFLFSLAARPGINEVVDAAGVGSFGSCILTNPRYENLGAGASFIGVPPGTEFNDGVAIYRGKFRVKFSVPALTQGQTFGSSFKHVLCQRSSTGRIKMVQYSDSARGKLLPEVRDAGTEIQGMVRMWFTNINPTTTAALDVEVIFEAW